MLRFIFTDFFFFFCAPPFVRGGFCICTGSWCLRKSVNDLSETCQYNFFCSTVIIFVARLKVACSLFT